MNNRAEVKESKKWARCWYCTTTWKKCWKNIGKCCDKCMHWEK